MRLTEEQYRTLTGKEPPPSTSSLLQIQSGDLKATPAKRDKFLRAPKEERLGSNGRTFHSRKEMLDYEALHLRELAGEIRNLECQITYPLQVNGALVAKYVADFRYEEWNGEEWEERVADTKPDFSKFSPSYLRAYQKRPDVQLGKLKRALCEILYKITILEL